MAKDGGAADPLRNPRFQEPSVWQLFRESLFGKPRLLDCIQVEVTSVCPGRCVYCPHTTQAGYWRSRHMEAATFARLWPLMQESGRVHLQGWGEPFLHPRFMDFAALARKAGCRVSTTTCGLRMDETLAGQIVGSGIDIVAFSLVGTDEASNAPACRSAASVRPCARSSASAKPKWACILSCISPTSCSPRRWKPWKACPILWTNWTYTRR